MSEYYEPTLLFRQNAIRRFCPQLSPISSNSTLSLGSQGSNHSWMLKNNNSKDTEIINKVCSLDRVNIKSNYWKVPNNEMNLTSMAVNSSESNSPALAISSASESSNLYIYELDAVDNYLTHHNTITLPNIHSMKWIPKSSEYLVTGNSRGYAHLISIPGRDSDESASICKRFNHRKHIRSKNGSSTTTKSKFSGKISKMNFLNDRLLSVYENHLFYWDVRDCESQMKPSPISISSISGLKNFDPLHHNSNTIGVCGRFGVSLYDLRESKFSVPTSSMDKLHNRTTLRSNLIRCNPSNENILAASHDDGVVRLWDIRKQDSFAKLSGHGDKITSLEWNNGDLFTGGWNGTIVHWDLTSEDSAGISDCRLKEGFDSVNFNPYQNSLNEILSQRQCGTILPASNNSIVSMCSISTEEDSYESKVLSIDSNSFFGLHSKSNDAISVSINANKEFYTEEDIQLLVANTDSNNTLVSRSSESLEVANKIEPLAISRKPTIFETPQLPDSNLSQDTLLGSTDDLLQKDSHMLGIDISQFTNDEDFVFTQPMLPMQNSNTSSTSVDSVNMAVSSPNSSMLSNGSMDTLSTTPTITNSPYQDTKGFTEPSLHKSFPSFDLSSALGLLALDSDEFSFNFAKNPLDDLTLNSTDSYIQQS